MPVELSADGETRRRVNDNVRFITGAGLPTDGSTGADICGPGSFYFDIVDAIVYINTGTIDSPVWTELVANIGAGAIGTTELEDLAVTTAKLANLAATTAKINDLAVTTGKIDALAVTAAKLAADAVTTAKILDLNVTTAKLALLAVGNGQIAPSAITADKTASTVFQQATGTISSSDITDTAVGKFGHANGQVILAGPGAAAIIEWISLILIYDYSTAAYGAGGDITVNRSGGAGALSGLISAANSVGAAGDRIVRFLPLSAAAANLTLNEGLNLVTSAAFTQPGTAAGVIRYICNYRIHATGL